MAYQIAHHRLLSDHVQHESSDKHSGQFASGLPDTIVIHYTGSGTMQSAVNQLLDIDVKASAHLVIGRNGSIVQLMPFDRIAWHAGVSEYQGRKNLNRYSIGIELENAGRLRKAGDQYIAWFGRAYGEDEVIQATHMNESEPCYWHRYTEAQMSALMDVCRLLCSAYGISTIVGHDEIAPGRKIDPGPALPIEAVRQRILLSDRQEGIDQYTQIAKSGIIYHGDASLLSEPDAASPLVSVNRFKQGTAVDIKGELNGWYRVSVPIEGWVKKENVQLENEQLHLQQVIDV